MSILSSNHPVENQVSNSISRFLSDFQVIRLFRACGCVKMKGISVEFLFTYILGNAFRSSSFYMQQRMQELRGCFSKNTYYRFLANPHVNWLHFTTRLAVRIIEQFLKPLTSENRRECFVIDDSLYERAGYKLCALAASAFVEGIIDAHRSSEGIGFQNCSMTLTASRVVKCSQFTWESVRKR